MLRTAHSPRTDNGRWSWRKYVISHCRREILQYTSRSHFTPLQSSSATCEQDRLVGRNVSLLDQGVQLQIFHLLDFSLVASLDLGRREVRRSRHLRSMSEIARSAFGQASSFTSNFTLSSHPDVKNLSCHLVPSSKRFSSSTGSS